MSDSKSNKFVYIHDTIVYIYGPMNNDLMRSTLCLKISNLKPNY
jgi:hypothetical protein